MIPVLLLEILDILMKYTMFQLLLSTNQSLKKHHNQITISKIINYKLIIYSISTPSS